MRGRTATRQCRGHLYSIKQIGEDLCGVLVPDEFALPCVERVWRLEPFEEDVVDLAASAWLRMGETLKLVSSWLGAEGDEISLDCLHASEQVQVKLYRRELLQEWFDEMPGPE